MIRLFRKIRKKLLSQKSYGLYVLYASGEIVLVIVGIVLALQLDSWHTMRENRKEEHRILRDISDEIEFNKFLLEKGTEYMTEVIDASNRLLEVINDPSSTPSIEELEMDFHKLTLNWMSSRNTSMYDVLSGSGELNLISSMELRKKLTDLKANQELLYRFEELQSRLVDQQVKPFLNRSIDRTTIRSYYDASELIITHHPSPFHSQAEDLLQNQEFANLLIDLSTFTQKLLNSYARIGKDLAKMESLIESTSKSTKSNTYTPY